MENKSLINYYTKVYIFNFLLVINFNTNKFKTDFTIYIQLLLIECILY